MSTTVANCGRTQVFKKGVFTKGTSKADKQNLVLPFFTSFWNINKCLIIAALSSNLENIYNRKKEGEKRRKKGFLSLG